MSKSQCYAVKGLRPGVQLSVPDSRLQATGGARHVVNGAIAGDDTEAIKFLRDSGYQLVPSEAKPEFDQAAYQARRRQAGLMEAV